MDKERFIFLNSMLNQNWTERHDIPQMHFTSSDLRWLMEQAEKVERLQETNRSLTRMVEEGLTFKDVYNLDDEIHPQ